MHWRPGNRQLQGTGHTTGKGFLFPTLIIVFVFLSFGESFASAGETALSFLFMTPDSRSAAMGSSGIALSSGSPSSVWINPALIKSAENPTGSGMTVGYISWIEGMNAGFLAANFDVFSKRFGAGARFMSSGVMERRGEEPETEPAGVFDASEMTFYITHATRIGKFRIGVLSEILYQRIDTQTVLGWDAGAGFVLPLGGGMNFGGAVRNLGPDFGGNSGKSPLPASIVLGVSGEELRLNTHTKLSTAMDIEFIRKNGCAIEAGFEGEFSEIATLRFGLRSWSRGNIRDGGLWNSVSPTAGGGLKMKKMRIDYTCEGVRNGLGISHRFQIGIGF